MVKSWSRRSFLAYGSATVGSSLLLKACTNGENDQTVSDNQKEYKIAIALPGVSTDKAWNQSGFAGVKLAKEKFGVEISTVEQVSQSDQMQVLSNFARRGSNLVFAHGGQFDAAIQQVASQYPNTFFIGVNGAVSGGNFGSLRLNHLQGSYLCGIIAASMSKSNKIAYIGGQKFQATEEELRGLELGAKSVKPDIKINSTFTGDWNDIAKAKEATISLISSGADIVYQWLDAASPAVLQTASEKGVYAFGNTNDQLDIAPSSVLTSAVKRLDLAIAYITDLGMQGKLKGEVYKLGLERPDILYLGKYNKAVSKELQTKVEKAKKDIVESKINFAECREGSKETVCIK